MFTNHFNRLFLVSILAFLTGCWESDMPEVNEQNCLMENIKKLDEEIKQEFASKCLRRVNTRAGEFKESPQKEW